MVNHGVPESLMTAMIESSQRFFNLPENEKQELNHGDEFQYFARSASTLLDKQTLFFRVTVHPDFFSPDKPTGFRYTVRQKWFLN